MLVKVYFISPPALKIAVQMLGGSQPTHRLNHKADLIEKGGSKVRMGEL